MSLLECVEQQLGEIEVLQSIYPNQHEVDIKDHSVFMAMKSYVETDGKSFPPTKMLPVTLNIELGEDKGNLIVEINLPLTYPSKCTPDVFLRLDKLSRQSQQLYNEELKIYIQELDKGETCLYQIVQWATENVPDIEIQTENSKPENISEKDSKSETFTRLWIYSHHIYNKVKRKSIIEWAKELELTGFSMPGKPGIVCVEGTQLACEEYWQRVKQLNWKHIEVRHRDDQTNDNITKQFITMEEISFEAHGHRNNHMNMGAFYAFLNDNQCGYAFENLFGVAGRLSADK